MCILLNSSLVLVFVFLDLGNETICHMCIMLNSSLVLVFFFIDLGNETIRNLPEYFGLVALLQVGEFHYGRRL